MSKRRKITDFFLKDTDKSSATDSESVVPIADSVTQAEPSTAAHSSTSAAATEEMKSCSAFDAENCLDIGEIVGHDVAKLSAAAKLKIINWKEPSTTIFPLIQEGNHSRSFQHSWLTTYSWLRYSHCKTGGMCVACALFGAEFVGRGNHQNPGIFVKTPMAKYKKATELLKKHHACTFHNESMIKLEEFVTRQKYPEKRIANLLNQQRLDEIERNKKLLVPIIQSLLFCGRNVLPIRGHRDDGPINAVANHVPGEGVFRSLLRFRLKAGDKDLIELFDRSPSKPMLISKTTQNELLSIIGQEIQEKIVSKVKENAVFSVLMDETQDISCKEQATIIIRYVDECGAVVEEFVGFCHAADLSGKGLALLLQNHLSKLGLDISKCRGQGYDGAAAMMGKLRGCAQNILKESHLAFPVHCFSHRLNLVLSKSCEFPPIRNMISILTKVCDYVKSSSIRTKKLENILNESYSDEIKRRRLVRLCPTRWVQRHDSIIVFIEMIPAVVQFLSLETTSDAAVLLSAVLSSQFVIGLKICESVMVHTVYVSEGLQKVNQHLGESYSHIRNLKTTLQSLRTAADTKFHDVFVEAEKLLREIGGSDVIMPRCCVNQRNRGNVSAATPEDYYRNNGFIPFLDSILVQLDERFGADNVPPALAFQELMPRFQSEGSLNRVCEAALVYRGDINRPEKVVEAEIQRWLALPHSVIITDDTKSDLENSLSAANDRFFPAVSTMLRIFGTLPVTTATAERTFSFLKRLKTYLRSTCEQERLSSLGLLACNPTVPIDEARIIDKYARRKNRRLLLL